MTGLLLKCENALPSRWLKSEIDEPRGMVRSSAMDDGFGVVDRIYLGAEL